jgi:hypothetical protein
VYLTDCLLQQIGHSKIFLRRDLADKLERLAKLRVLCGARTLTRFGLRVVQRRLSLFLVVWARFRLHMLKVNRNRRAATKLVSVVRRYKQKQSFRKTKSAIVLLQSQQRRMGAFNSVRKLRDPFIDMTFRDCKRLLRENQKELDDAIKSKNFRRAAALEAKM